MKIFFYTLRPFDELGYCEEFSKKYGIDYVWTADPPRPDNLALAMGCDAVSTNPCEVTPAYLEAFAKGGVRYLPCRSIGYDHLPLEAAKRLGMRVSHSHYPPEGVANYTIMLMLMATRKMNQIMLRAAAQDYSLPGKMGRDLSGCTVGVIGAVSAVSGLLTVGQISCFLTYANQYTKPFNEVTGVIAQLQTAVAGAKRVFALLDQTNQSPDKEGAYVLHSCKGQIDIDNISFSYTPQQKLIEHFCLHVQPGQRVAIVGPTGCGKTTIINLLMRFYDVNSGRICIDGVDIRQVTRESLRSQYGMVLQESWLYHATVRENIAYGKPDAKQEEIEAAAKAAYAHGFICQLENGYDTVVGGGGAHLSGGERQRVSIARAMLKNAPIVILDEATAYIDPENEAVIQQAVARLVKGKTVIVIAHRLSTITDADQIFVIQDGRVAGNGTHKELLGQNKLYQEMWNAHIGAKDGDAA